MSELQNPTPAQLARCARQHVDSLRAAGVEWVPAASAPAGEPASSASAQLAPRSSPLLFAEIAKPSLSPEQRRQALDVLAEKVATCTRCADLARTRKHTVFGVGPIDAELCFVGEAPGADEDATGEPFVGAAGQLLNRIIAACGMKREQVYICNIIRCRPPGNRLPQVDEAANCREYLEKQLELVRPKFICALGACAAQNLLDTKAPIGRLRGQFHSFRGIPVLCTYHPAYLLRSPDRKKDVWEDMKKLLQRMGRPIK
jgi:uracil-DNA glycosylase family 4